MPETEDGLQVLKFQGLARAVNELLIHLVHRATPRKEQVAAQFQLEHRILILEPAALLFFPRQGKAQRAGINRCPPQSSCRSWPQSPSAAAPAAPPIRGH